MGENSKIEWTDSTWTPIRALNLYTGKIGWHCEHMSEGCRNCYAESMNRRLGTGLDFKPGHRADIEIFLDEKMLLAPLRWKTPRRIFVNSMTDTFADFVKDEWLDRMFAVMALCGRHQFQVLTKRPERMRRYLDVLTEMCDGEDGLSETLRWIGETAGIDWRNGAEKWPLPNVWLGVSAEDQATADERIPLLLQTPAAVRFVSLEPLLGPISFRWAQWDDWCDPKGVPRQQVDEHDGLRMIDWVVVGGESGPHARPMHPAWVRSLRDQCAAAGVPFFFKQWGGRVPLELLDDGRPEPWRRNPNGETTWILDELSRPRGELEKVAYIRVGKKAAGRLLDGVEHNGMPRFDRRETAQSEPKPTASS